MRCRAAYRERNQNSVKENQSAPNSAKFCLILIYGCKFVRNGKQELVPSQSNHRSVITARADLSVS